MPKWQLNITRDTSQDAEVVVGAETAEEAEQIFLHDMDRDVIQWREGDWIGDTDIVEVLPADDDAELTHLDDASQKSPGPDDADTQTRELAVIVRQIHQIIEKTEAGEGRVLLDPEDLLKLQGLANRLPVIAGELTAS
jgi:hypothetical protein